MKNFTELLIYAALQLYGTIAFSAFALFVLLTISLKYSL